jgi:hypothetical protein
MERGRKCGMRCEGRRGTVPVLYKTFEQETKRFA